MISTLVPKLAEPVRPDRNVRVAAKAPFLHVAVADSEVKQRLAQVRQVIVGFLAAAEVGLADDFDQGHAAAVQIDIGLWIRFRHSVVDRFAGVVLQMKPGDAECFLPPVDDLPVLGPLAGEHPYAAVLPPAGGRTGRSGSPLADPG